MAEIPYGYQRSNLYLGNYVPLSDYLYANQGRSTQFSDPEVGQLSTNAAGTQAAAAAKAAGGAQPAPPAAPSLGALGLDESIYNAYHGSPFDWSQLGAGYKMTNAGPVIDPTTAAQPPGTAPGTAPGGGTGAGGTGGTGSGTPNPTPAPTPPPGGGGPARPPGRPTHPFIMKPSSYNSLSGYLYGGF